jgi:hypothetical protein
MRVVDGFHVVSCVGSFVSFSRYPFPPNMSTKGTKRSEIPALGAFAEITMLTIFTVSFPLILAR